MTKKSSMVSTESRYNVEAFKTSGFKAKGDKSLAFISIKIALSAFLGTYKKLRTYTLHCPDEISDSAMYFETYTEVIVHFQHFFEIIIKDILRSEHELYAAKIGKNKGSGFDALIELTRSCVLSPNAAEGLFSVEFDEAIYRLERIQIKNLKREKIKSAILCHKKAIGILNELRNRTWHRGAYFLPLEQLDRFVCKSILPAVLEIEKVNYYNALPKFLPYAQKAGINVLLELAKCYRSPSINVSKINLLKEIGRSTYESPYSNYYVALKAEKRKKSQTVMLNGKSVNFSASSGWLRLRTANDGERLAQILADEKNSELASCPVCGRKTLLLISVWSDDFEGGSVGSVEYIPEAECKTCTFHIFDDINLSRQPYKISNFFKR